MTTTRPSPTSSPKPAPRIEEARTLSEGPGFLRAKRRLGRDYPSTLGSAWRNLAMRRTWLSVALSVQRLGKAWQESLTACVLVSRSKRAKPV
jgi:hypothetical protein